MPALDAHLSRSSPNTYLIGFDARAWASVLPHRVSMPPGYAFCVIVFLLSRLGGSDTFFFSGRVSLIIGAMRSFENSFASPTVGWMKRMLPGSSSMM